MPHIDIKFIPPAIVEADLNTLRDILVEITARVFKENITYVSADVIARSPLARGCKAIDIEVNASPDDEGHRIQSASQLTGKLLQATLAYLRDAGYTDNVTVSAWVRIFVHATYQTKDLHTITK
jgi:hypothetical protein